MRRFADTAVALLLPSGRRVARYFLEVEGYLYPHEGTFLHCLAFAAPGRGAVVEIGSFRGRSTLCLASGVLRRGEGKVIAIDPQRYGTGETLVANLRRFHLDRCVEIRADTSLSVARGFEGKARIVFVDGDHSDDAVRADVAAWLPHLDAGGFLVLHDATSLSGFPGPRALADALRHAVGPDGTFQSAGTIGSIAWFRARGGERFQPSSRGRAWVDPLLKSLRGSTEPLG
ncbi:MAG TPA: class I SAM-dependent methyltransferase [Candidatus Polarisedimenticolia bacterium]|jgi:predicted O-methyltransferase YrrM|nr:class I SAM-dependent methyltransferase [Candidatus Polarisedimenticolia bacterium]